MTLLKSNLYRSEIKHWLLVVSLMGWSLISSFLALRAESKIILIGIDENGSRIITDSNDRILQNELKNFLKTFLLNYYTYDESNYSKQIELSSNLISNQVWEQLKPKLLEIKEKLKKSPLSQSSDIESIDLIDQGKIESILKIGIKSKIAEQTIKLKVRLGFTKIPRTEQNPWGFEITEVSEYVL